jgi:hypothetical protein
VHGIVELAQHQAFTQLDAQQLVSVTLGEAVHEDQPLRLLRGETVKVLVKWG